MIEKYFFVKRFTMMLLYMYQIFSALLSHLHFLCIFSSLLWSTFFVDTPYIFTIIRLIPNRIGQLHSPLKTKLEVQVELASRGKILVIFGQNKVNVWEKFSCCVSSNVGLVFKSQIVRFSWETKRGKIVTICTKIKKRK